MNRLASFCMLSHGWQRAVLLLFAGAIAGFSMPPWFFLPGLFLAIPIWIWCLDGAEMSSGWRRVFGAAFWIGFWFALGYFCVALHWIGAAFFVDGGWLLYAMPFAVLGLGAVLALFWGFASAAAHLFWHNGASRFLALALFLTIAEFARGHLFTGFPFDLLGYALTANDQMIQLASVIGVYGLTLLVILLAATPALIWPADKRDLSQRLAPFFAAILILVAQIGFGQYRLQTVEIIPRADMRLRLVQPNILQAVKWQAESSDFILDRLISLSEAQSEPNKSGLVAITHLVWPESAFPFYLSQHPEALARIARMLPVGTTLLTGAPWLENDNTQTPVANNAILAINAEGEVTAKYAKTHLVPFGEYLPFKNIWAHIGLKQFVPGNEGWTAGKSRRLMSPDKTPSFLPLVCYEAIFSGDLGDAIEGAQFILNLTNDGWFDGSIGPLQHFYHVRLRAVEEGKALIRVANTGVTAMIDPLGHVQSMLGQGQVGLLDVVPSQPIAAPFFAKYRHWPLFFIGLGISVWVFWRGRIAKIV